MTMLTTIMVPYNVQITCPLPSTYMTTAFHCLVPTTYMTAFYCLKLARQSAKTALFLTQVDILQCAEYVDYLGIVSVA